MAANLPGGIEHPVHLSERPLDIRDELQAEAGDHGVEGAVVERELLGIHHPRLDIDETGGIGRRPGEIQHGA